MASYPQPGSAPSPYDQNSQMWYYGGQAQGPAPATNPLRQWAGDFVESIGNAIPLIK